MKDFVIECWDTNTYDWVDEWDSTNSLPPMVRITLAFTLGDSKNHIDNSAAPVSTVTREIAIPSNTLPSVAQTGSPNTGGGAGAGVGGGGNNNGQGRNGQGRNGANGNGQGGNGQGRNNGAGRNGSGGYQPGGGGPPGGFGTQNPR
ncbi:MAG: hypothetical protein WDN00_11745 [Limisphaerales bacterium]